MRSNGSADPVAAARVHRYWQDMVSIRHVLPGDADHPFESAPWFGDSGLFVAGELPRARPLVALVGARAATGDALAMAVELSRAVVESGATVVSGTELGTEEAALRGALSAGPRAVAIAAGGLQRLEQLRHAALFAEICRRGGALLSLAPGAAPPRAFRYEQRNRLLAAVAEFIVVVEAGPRSGALAVARHAYSMSRVVAAVPGSAGCRALIAAGAASISGAQDLRRLLAGAPPAVTLPRLERDTIGAELLRQLQAEVSETVDTLARKVRRDARAVLQALAILELEGLVLVLPGSRYRLTRLGDRVAAGLG